MPLERAGALGYTVRVRRRSTTTAGLARPRWAWSTPRPRRRRASTAVWWRQPSGSLVRCARSSHSVRPGIVIATPADSGAGSAGSAGRAVRVDHGRVGLAVGLPGRVISVSAAPACSTSSQESSVSGCSGRAVPAHVRAVDPHRDRAPGSRRTSRRRSSARRSGANQTRSGSAVAAGLRPGRRRTRPGAVPGPRRGPPSARRKNSTMAVASPPGSSRIRPVHPADRVVLAVGVVVAPLGAPHLVAHGDHRGAGGQQQGGGDVAGLPGADAR